MISRHQESANLIRCRFLWCSLIKGASLMFVLRFRPELAWSFTPRKGGGANCLNCGEQGVLLVSLMQVLFKQEALQDILQTLLVKTGTTEQLLPILFSSFRKWRFISPHNSPNPPELCWSAFTCWLRRRNTDTQTVFSIFVLYPSCKKISFKCFAHFNTVSASVCSWLRLHYVGNSETNKSQWSS